MEGEQITTPRLRIIADHREANAEVVGYLRRIPGIELEMAQLTTGDYEVDESYVFERKCIRDFAASIIDGRLFSQATRLAKSGAHSAIILEGNTSEIPGLRREPFQGALISLSLVFQIPVLHSSGPEETAHLICYAAGQLWRAAHDQVARGGYRPKRRRRMQLHILQGLPGIGPKRANDLIDQFGTVAAVIAASAKDLASVNGIGPKTANRIRWILD